MRVLRAIASKGFVFLAAGALLLSSPSGGPGRPSLAFTAPGSDGYGSPQRAAATGAAHAGIDVAHDVSRPLRVIAKLPRRNRFAAPATMSASAGEAGLEPSTAAPRAAGGAADPVLQPQVLGAAPSPYKSFNGMSQGENSVTGMPPDPEGAVGLTKYVQYLNFSFAVYSKNGSLQFGPVLGDSIWSGFNGPCGNGGDGDPVVLYDQLADRWLVSQMRLPNYPNGPGDECIAVSTTGNPAGSWNRYQFQVTNAAANTIMDAPKIGIWPDGYYFSANLFTVNNHGVATFAGVSAVAFNRTQMLAGQGASYVRFDLDQLDNTVFAGLLPADFNGTTLPPSGEHEMFMQIDDDANGYPRDQLDIWQFDPNWPNPTNANFSQVGTVGVAAFDLSLCGGRICIPQPGTSQKLDGLTDRLMFPVEYRNLGSSEALVANHTVDANGNGKAGVRWYVLNKSGVGPWMLGQQGTYSPDSDNRWMGSIAMDASGDVALGYSVSSSSTNPSVRYTGRLAGDTPGQMTLGEGEFVAGGGHQTSSGGRWGDYSTMGVDPADGCTFWYTQEYYASSSTQDWKTRIGAVRFPGCNPSGDTTPPTDLMVSKPNSPFWRSGQVLDPIQVAWSATDTGSGVDSYDVSERHANFDDAAFGAKNLWLPATPQTSGAFLGLPGRTYCFSIVATDVAGNVSQPSSESCTAVPLDDSDGRLASTGFTKKFANGYYLGTYSLAKARGASLSLGNVHADRIQVIVAKCPGCGAFDVFWQGSKIAHVKTAADTTQKRRYVNVATFGAVQTGQLEFDVTTDGKPVKIDGVAITRL